MHIEDRSKQQYEIFDFSAYEALIEDDDLLIFMTPGWVESPYMNGQTKEQIKQSVDDP